MSRTYRLSTAELTILTASLAATSPRGSGVAQQQAARRSLRQRGLLVSAPLEDSEGVASELAPLLATALWPDCVCVLELTRPPHETQTIHLSLTPSSAVANRVDRDGRHVLAELDTIDEALDLITTASGLDSAANPVDTAPVAVEDLLPRAEMIAVLLRAAPVSPSPANVRSVCWLLVNGAPWLAAASPDPAESSARPIGVDELRALLADAMQPFLSAERASS